MMKRTASLTVKIIFCGAIMLTLLGCGKYKLGWLGGVWGYLGLEIVGTDEHRSSSAYWVTGYNFSENFIYGKTPVSWFVSNMKTYEDLVFRTESDFQEYLRKNNIEFKKLIDVPIFKIPDLSYGYYLFGTGAEKTILQLEKQKGNDSFIESRIVRVGRIDEYVIGENNKGWFCVHMPTDKKQSEKSTDELADILGVNKDELLRKTIDVPDYAKYKLPFKNFRTGLIQRTESRYALYRNNEGSTIQILLTGIEYHKRKKGYLYGKSMTDFFIFDTKDENCVYFGQKKDDWLKELDRLNLSQSGFTKVPGDELRKLKQDPWL